MHGAARLFPSLFAGSDREKIRSAAAASAGVRTRVRPPNGFEIPPAESRRVTLTADRRLLARFDGTAGQWRINQGSYHVEVGKGANDLHLSADTKPAEALFGT
jgi:beta-glucosidase